MEKWWIEIKIKSFLQWVQNTLLYRPDVKVSTVVMFIQEFSRCLSDVERNRVEIELKMITQFSLKQITIEGFIDDIKTKQLDDDLKKLKKTK